MEKFWTRASDMVVNSSNPGSGCRCALALARALHQVLNWTRQARFEVQQFRPSRLDGDSHHLLIQPAHLGFKGWHPCIPDLLARRLQVFGRHALDGVE